MAVDFDALVIGPCMDIFAREIVVEPRASQPFGASFTARGVYAEKPVDVQMQDGTIMSSAVKTLGVRVADFAVPVIAGDQVTVAGATFVIDDTDDDGEGGSLWTLKEIR